MKRNPDSANIAEVLESVRTGYDPAIRAPAPRYDLFGTADAPIGDGAVYLPGMAGVVADDLIELVKAAAKVAPFRHFETPGGKRMKVVCTNLGPLGWVSSTDGYGYRPIDPLSGRPWMPMPEWLVDFARHCARQAGFFRFEPTGCLINGYRTGDSMGLHQDRDERDLSQPIVSISLGLPAVFQLGGVRRQDRIETLELQHTDVVVMGGKSRLRFHGVAELAPGRHPATGSRRINLTIRQAD